MSEINVQNKKYNTHTNGDDPTTAKL
jgi:hypothetical protein